MAAKPQFDAAAKAAALLAGPAAKGRPDFAVRAAACLLMADNPQAHGFDIVALWPGFMTDFKPGDARENLAVAAALIAAAQAAHAPAQAAA